MRLREAKTAVQHIERHRMHRALGLASGAVADEAPRALAVEDGLGQNRARRIAGAQEQDVEGTVHGNHPQQAVAGAAAATGIAGAQQALGAALAEVSVSSAGLVP